MRTLLRKPWRDLRALGLRAWAVIGLAAATAAAYAGGSMARDSIRATRDALYRDLHLAHLHVEFVAARAEELPPLTNLPGVTAVGRRYLAGNHVEFSDGSEASALLVHLESAASGVNDLAILEGHAPSPEDVDGVVIDRNASLLHDVHLGDRLYVETLGQPRELHVVGIGISPDLLMATANPNLLVPSKGSLAVVFVPMTRVSTDLGYPLYNSLAFRFASTADVGHTEEVILERLASLDLTRVTPRRSAFADRLIELDLQAFDVFIPAVVGLLGLIAALATALCLGRLVQTQRPEIATLFALGYRPRHAAASLLLLGLLLLAAAVPLAAVGSLGLGTLLADAYARGVGMPLVTRLFSLEKLGVGMLATAGLLVIATLWPIVRVVRLAPQVSLRDPPRTNPRWFRRLRQSFGSRYALRSLARHPGFTALTCVALAFANAGTLAVRSLSASLDEIAQRALAREGWDATVDFRVPVGGEETAALRATAGIVQVEPYYRAFARLELPSGAADFIVIGVPPELTLRRLDLEEGHLFSSPEAPEALINRGWGDTRALRIGDHVRLRTARRSVEVRIVGFLSDVSIGEITVPLSVAQSLFEKADKVTGVLVRSTNTVPDLQRAMRRLGGVERVFGRAEISRAVTEMLAMLGELTSVVSGIALLVATLVLFSTVYLTVLERQSEYGILAALGYIDREIGGIVLREVAILGGLALGMGVPLGIVLAALLNHALSAAWLPLPFLIRPADLAWALVPTCALLPLATVPALLTLYRASVPTMLRSRSFG